MDVTDFDQAAIRSVIARQLEAFRNDDAMLAFSFASPTIRHQFGTAENFLRMVRLGYYPLYRSRSVMFEAIATVNGNLIQPVLLLSDQGELVKASYVMERQDDIWRIQGCFVTYSRRSC
jgi:hypothetical protein